MPTAICSIQRFVRFICEQWARGNNTLRSCRTHTTSKSMSLSLSGSLLVFLFLRFASSIFLAGFCSRITLHNRTLDAYLNYYKLVFIFAENLNDFGLLHHCNKLAHTHCVCVREKERVREIEIDRERGRYTHIFTETNFKLKWSNSAFPIPTTNFI